MELTHPLAAHPKVDAWVRPGAGIRVPFPDDP